ncbi:MAG: glycine--tRNA ligase [Actinobacteria bacterium]|nr:glycine--tRNA ligase [Actinomycetota bacterium]
MSTDTTATRPANDEGATPSVEADLPTLVELCKKRGIIFPSSEIYGGFRSTWDYGPLGVELKENIKRQWWRTMVQLRSDVVGLDASILMHPKVWEASGHLANFADPLVECTDCHRRFREDHLREDIEAGLLPEFRCPECKGALTDPRNFNLMFKTYAGPLEDDSAVVWMRPETAQAMFVDFATIQRGSRMKVPFGIAQMGKSFRNEITPGNFIFRTREFEQMEMEFFCEPGSDEEWHQYWIDARLQWYVELGLRRENLRIREHEADELSHYAKRTVDVEYFFPDASMQWSELEGIANRTDFDLKAHQEASGQDLTYYDQPNDRRYHPYVIEPAAGATRATLAFLYDAYRVEEAPDADGKMQSRTVLRLDPRLAPYKVAVLPLSKKEELTPTAEEVFDLVKVEWMAEYDETQSIGRRYRRQDEIGTPYCVTVDFDTIEDRAVTVRDRDTMTQDRVSIDRLVDYLRERLPR